MEQEQAPQTAAPAPTQAPAAPAPQAAPPPAAPAAPHVLPANYIPPGTRPTVDDVVNAFPQEAADAAGIPQRAEVNGETQLPGGGTAKGGVYAQRSPTPSAGMKGQAVMPVGPGQMVGEAALATDKKPAASIAYQQGDKNQGLGAKVDEKGNVIVEAQHKDENGDGGAARLTHDDKGTAVALEGQDGGLSTRTEVAVDPDGNPAGVVDVNYLSNQMRAGLHAGGLGTDNPTLAADLKAQAALTEKLRLEAELNAKLGKKEQEATVGLGLKYKPHETVELGLGVNAGVRREGETTQPVVEGQGTMTVTPGATPNPPSP